MAATDASCSEPQIETKLLTVTRGRTVQLHLIGHPTAAVHAVEHSEGRADLYVDHKHHSEHANLESALAAASSLP